MKIEKKVPIWSGHIITTGRVSRKFKGGAISPAEIRAQNIIGSGVLGTMTLVNTVNESRNIVIEIQSPPELISEQQHLRVICENCHDTHQRYEIVNERCPKCDSSDLTVYERMPEDFSLEDLQYRLFVLQKLENAENQLKQGNRLYEYIY